MSIAFVSTWLVGVINGYKLKEEGLPASIKYGSMILSTGLGIVKGLGNLELPVTRPGSTMLGLLIGIPLVTGATFCSGSYLGKAIRYAKDVPDTEKGAKVHLL